MKIKNVTVSLIFFTLFISSPAYSEQSTSSTGKYNSDLGQVYGAIQATKFMKEICSDKVPKLIEQNETAYQKWRVKYKAFLQEIERHYSRMLWNEAGGNPEKHMQVMNKYDNDLQGYKTGLARLMQNDGDKVFFQTCAIYPVYLTTERMNLEYFYAEQVQTIRRKNVK